MADLRMGDLAARAPVVGKPMQSQGVMGSIDQGGDFIDKILSAIDKISAIAEKTGSLGSLASKLDPKLQQKEADASAVSSPRPNVIASAKEPSYSSPAPPPSQPVPPTREPDSIAASRGGAGEFTIEQQELIDMVSKIDALDIGATLEQIKTAVPDEWREKSLDEIIAAYSELGGIKKDIVDIFIKRKLTEFVAGGSA